MGLLDEAVLEIASNRNMRFTWYAVIVVFGVSAILAVVFYRNIASSLLGQYFINETQQIKQLANYVNVTGPLYVVLPVIIFAKNSLTDLIAYGLLVTLVAPIGVIIFNGGFLGFVTAITLPYHGNVLVEFYLLAPHGVIEIPAFSLTVASISLLRKGVDYMYFKGFSLFLVSLVMLLVAAVFESTVTIGAGALVGLITSHAMGVT